MLELSLKDKLEKLRKACNECNAAKTRCSGEKTGCNRCKTLDLRCVYEQSRVGKVPGVRAKKAKARNGSNPKRDSAHLTSPLGALHGSAMGGMQGHNEHHYFGDHELEGWSPGLRHPVEHGRSLLSDDMDGFFDGTFELEDPLYQMQPAVRSAQSPSTVGTDLIDSNLNFDFDDVEAPSLVATSTTSTTSEIPGPHVAPTLPRAQPPLAEPPPVQKQSSSDSQCILACCAIVTNLESYIDAQIKVLDLALDVVRKAVTSLTQIIDQASNSRCCHMLLAAIMYQIVLMLERSCATFLEQHHAAAAAGSGSSNENSGDLPQLDSVGGMLSGFGFSGFRVDAGEQRAWRARVVLKEIRLVDDILKRITALTTQDKTVPMPASAEQSCHHEVTKRLEKLAAQLKKVQNT